MIWAVAAAALTFVMGGVLIRDRDGAGDRVGTGVRRRRDRTLPMAQSVTAPTRGHRVMTSALPTRSVFPLVRKVAMIGALGLVGACDERLPSENTLQKATAAPASRWMDAASVCRTGMSCWFSNPGTDACRAWTSGVASPSAARHWAEHTREERLPSSWRLTVSSGRTCWCHAVPRGVAADRPWRGARAKGVGRRGAARSSASWEGRISSDSLYATGAARRVAARSTR